MIEPDVAKLLDDLKADHEATRQAATEALWRRWYTQKGAYGAQLLVRSQTLLEAGHTAAAEALLNELIRDQPDFAEAWNRRAVLYYLQERYWDAIADCDRVLAMIPYHFGALHGLGLCHAALANYTDAIHAFRRALAVQPHAIINQRLILECTAKLS